MKYCEYYIGWLDELVLSISIEYCTQCTVYYLGWLDELRCVWCCRRLSACRWGRGRTRACRVAGGSWVPSAAAWSPTAAASAAGWTCTWSSGTDLKLSKTENKLTWHIMMRSRVGSQGAIPMIAVFKTHVKSFHFKNQKFLLYYWCFSTRFY